MSSPSNPLATRPCPRAGPVAQWRLVLGRAMDEDILLQRIAVNPKIFGGKPIIRGHRLAVEHVLSMLATGDSPQDILDSYSWLESDDIRACLVYAKRLVAHERMEPIRVEA
jgi:uncharacterized protein (DUF433 family)